MKERTKAAILISLVLLCMGAVGEIDRRTMAVSQQDVDKAVPMTAKEQKIASFMAKQGSNEPELMARAIAKRKRPRLMAAVAAVESNGNPHAVGKVGEVTAWQIRQELWGHPGFTVEDHSIKAEEILEQLIKEENGRLVPALSRYNGDRSGKYAARVMAKVAEVRL